MDEREYSLMEHLAELRKRLGYALVGVALVSVAGFAVSDQILDWLREPMEQMLREVHGPASKFVVIAPAEYIVAQLKAAFVAALFIASPWVLYQIWMFIAPGLYAHEQRYASWFVWAGAVCFCGGAAFAYFAVFPTMFRFFVESLPPDIAMMPSISDHFSFTLKMLIAFGVVFETPVVTIILSLAGIIDPTKLGQYRKYVVVVAFIVGAVLTPSPDALSQLLLAGPLLLLYEIGVLISRMVVKMKGTPLSRAQRDGKGDSKAAATTTDAPPPPSGSAP